MPLDVPSPLAAGQVLGGRYALRRPLDRGGMAEVWEAHDTVLDRAVAVKTLHPHLAAAEVFLDRFRLEAVATARLAHPGIVATFDTGIDGGTAYIVMELVRGRSLRDELADRRVDVSEAVAIAFQVADALEHAHRHGVVHRDIKPGNILVCDEGGYLGPRVKVTDFGIARLTDALAETPNPDLTQTGAVVGTAKYLSPEQVEGHQPDERSDVYALGVVLYEMLSGQPPFAAASDLATAMLHVTTEPEPLAPQCPGLPPSVGHVTMQALDKDPDRRHPTAAAFAEALADTGVIDDAQPLVASGERTPPSGLAPHRRQRRRSRAPLAAVAAVAVGAVVVGALLLRPDGGPGRPDLGERRNRDGGLVSLDVVETFDPEGRDREENQDDAHLAVDRDPRTAWKTDRYNTRRFAGLKKGVGIVFVVSPSADLATLDLLTGSRGWAAEVYLAEAPRSSLAQWGAPVARMTSGGSDAEVALGDRRAGAVLLWITDLGEARRFSLVEATIAVR